MATDPVLLYRLQPSGLSGYPVPKDVWPLRPTEYLYGAGQNTFNIDKKLQESLSHPVGSLFTLSESLFKYEMPAVLSAGKVVQEELEEWLDSFQENVERSLNSVAFPLLVSVPFFERPLNHVLLAIDELCNNGELSEDTPTALACVSAQKILAEAEEIAQIYVDPTTVEASEGDLLIHWDSPAKSMVLICPGDGSAPSIYTEMLEGVVATTSQLRGSASAQKLSEALTWVMSPVN